MLYQVESSAYPKNLMTEWHARYGGKGIMIYWHVEKHGLHLLPIEDLFLV
jgi:TnpA family transposase